MGRAEDRRQYRAKLLRRVLPGIWRATKAADERLSAMLLIGGLLAVLLGSFLPQVPDRAQPWLAALALAGLVVYGVVHAAQELHEEDEAAQQKALGGRDAKYGRLRATAVGAIAKANQRLRETAAEVRSLREKAAASARDADPARAVLERLDLVVTEGATDTPRSMFIKVYSGIEEPTFLLNTAALFLFGDTGRVPVLRAAKFIKALRDIGLVVAPVEHAWAPADSQLAGLMRDERYMSAFAHPLADKVADAIRHEAEREALTELNEVKIARQGTQYDYVSALELLKHLGPWLRQEWWSDLDLANAILASPAGAGVGYAGAMAAGLCAALARCGLLEHQVNPDSMIPTMGRGGDGGFALGVGTPQDVYRLSESGWSIYKTATALNAPKAAP
jgi:hypothetical protein